jgi:hypothetical protein
MRVHVEGGGVVLLPPESFVAAGGEATVHAVGGTAYKVWSGPVDEGRLRALSALRVPGAVLPTALLRDDGGRVVGHAMVYLTGAVPLSRALSRPWRERVGLGPDEALGVVRRLRDLVGAAHRAGALVVDLHEGNVLLGDAWAPALVDTGSWQLPGWPATAVLDSVRDRHATAFDEGTDWFAFAVTTLQLLLGVHPYRGTHPTVKGLDERMRQRLSVLRPEVRRPPVAWPASVLPPRWRSWYASVLDGADRGAPPAGDGDGVGWLPSVAPTNAHLTWTPVWTAPRRLRAVVEAGGVTAALVDGAVWVGTREHLVRAEAITVTADGRVLAAARDGGLLRVVDVEAGRELPTVLAADAVLTLGHGFLVRSGPRLLQLELRGGVVGARLLAAVLPHATTLFDGVAVQDLLGAAHLSLVSPGRCETRRVPELDGWTVLDARHASGVVALVARRRGRTDRLVLRFGPGGHEVRRVEDVDGADLDLVVLPSGVAVLRVDGTLEVFRARPGDDEARLVEDRALVGSHLVALGAQLGVIGGARLFRLSLA